LTKKIIFINRFFYPDQSATAQILSDLLVNIEKKIDAEFYVVTSRNTYQNDTQLKPFENYNNIHINRVWTTHFGRANLLGRAFDYLSFYISAFFYLLRLVSKGDVVIAKTDPPVISFVAYLVSRLKKAHLINWLQDLFPEVAGELGLIKKQSYLFNSLKKLKNISLKAAEVNVVIGEKMANLVESQGVDSKGIKVIRNWSVNDRVQYVLKENNHLISEWRLTGKFVICYSGNFGRAHEYEPIKKLITELTDERVVFLFIGGGKYYDNIREYAESSSLKNVRFQPYQDKKDLNYSLSVADLHLISLLPSLEGLIVPSKFYGIASIGVPMLFIGQSDGEIGQVVQLKKCGFIAAPEDYKNIAEKVRGIMNNQDGLVDMSSNLSKLYEDDYQPGVAYQKWQEILLRFI